MLHIRFGQKYDWEPAIRHFIDSSRYECSFGPPDLNPEEYDWFVPLCLDDYQCPMAMPDVRGVRTLAPTRSVIRLCHDKLGFNHFLQDNGFGAQVPEILTGAPRHFPVLLKRRHGEWGTGVRLLHDRPAYDQVAALLADRASFIQRYIPGGREYALHILSENGELLWHRLMHYDMPAEGAYVNGRDCAPRLQRSSSECPHLPLFVAILARLGYTGTGCIDFKLTADGPMVFEFNPRPGSSLMEFVTEWLDAMSPVLADARSSAHAEA